MSKRLLDILISALGLAALAIPLALILFLVWRQDRHSPFYVADRVGMGGHIFRMVKIRSMIVQADKSGVESTSANDARITALGHFIRRWKVDELSQLWNVLKGDMSLVGPRPNTLNGVSVYTAEEKKLLNVRPGITDLSSIVFSDEGDILKDAIDADAEYDRLIRPWKSRLGLLYVSHANVILDIRLIWLTVVAVADKNKALRGVSAILHGLNSPDILIAVAQRNVPLAQFADDAKLA